MSAKEIVDQSSPAVVIIEATGDSGGTKMGTGFVVDAKGVIATNLHVISGESDIKIRTHDGVQYPVQSIANLDPGHDLALVRIRPKGALPVVRLGDSSEVSAGDKIFTIGNPLGYFDFTVSDGLISSVRPVSADLTILQISAPISQGSSGGPLFNQFGEVIGITTAIITGCSGKDPNEHCNPNDPAPQQINLAVPANYLKPMIAQQIKMSPTDFAEKTKEKEPPDERANADEEQHVQIVRNVPVHEVSVWDGCSSSDVADLVGAIGDAIQNGAPLYNTNTKQGYEACYRIYEGTALKYEQSSPCKGVRNAFGDGLLRANAMNTYKEKAWAMRDTFDGIMCVAKKWCNSNPKSCPAVVMQIGCPVGP